MNHALRPLVFVAAAAGFAGALGGLVWLALKTADAPPPTALQDQVRQKNLLDLQDSSARILLTYDWINAPKGILRMPIARAMELTAQEWQDPAAGRSNLRARAALALAVPPAPKEPAPGLTP